MCLPADTQICVKTYCCNILLFIYYLYICIVFRVISTVSHGRDHCRKCSVYCISRHPQQQSKHVLRHLMFSTMCSAETSYTQTTFSDLWNLHMHTPAIPTVSTVAPGVHVHFFCLLFLAALKLCTPRSDQVTLRIHGSVYLLICFLRNSISNLFFLFFFTIVRRTNYFMLLHLFTSPSDAYYPYLSILFDLSVLFATEIKIRSVKVLLWYLPYLWGVLTEFFVLVVVVTLQFVFQRGVNEN